MRRASGTTRAHEGTVLPTVLVMSSLLLGLACLGASATSSSRHTILELRCRRIASLAAASAFTEAAAVLESSVSVPSLSDPGQPRNLGALVTWPATVRVPVTVSAFRSSGVTIGDVRVESSDWRYETVRSGATVRFVRELGIVRMQARARVSLAGHEVTRQITIRRYATAERAGGSSDLVLRIRSADLVHEEGE